MDGKKIEVSDKVVNFMCGECDNEQEHNLLEYFKKHLIEFEDSYNSDKEVIDYIEDHEECEKCGDYACLIEEI